MKWLLFLLSVILVMACPAKRDKQELPSRASGDSALPISASHIPDTVYYEENGDYVQLSRESFLAIKPLRIFTSDAGISSFDIMMASFINTADIQSHEIAFSEEITHEYDKYENPVSGRFIYKNEFYFVKILTRQADEYTSLRLFINGKELRAGKELDVSASWSGFSDNIALRADEIPSDQMRR